MSTPSIKKNFAYKSALTLSSHLMAFVTFPYVSRVLGVERIGLVNFVDNTIGYFLLFAALGVNVLGVREIAAVKDDSSKISKVFSSILGQNLLSTLLVLLVYLALVTIVPRLNEYSELFYVGAAKIIGATFLVEWFFSGMENFRYITIRTLTIKFLYIIAVFVFVRTQEDYRLYFLLTVGSVVLNALVNFFYVRKFVSVRLKDLFHLVYLKRCCILGAFSIMTSMYLTFNVLCLGFVSDNTQVGYYTTAFKVYTVILSLFSSFTSVMLPRMSALLAEGDREHFQHLADKSFRLMFTYSIPMVICAIILAPQIIFALSGPGYEGAIAPMRVIMPAALFVAIAQILSMQVLAPMKNDRILFSASAIGAAVCLLVNVWVVPDLQSLGSAIVLLISEVAVTITYIVWVHRMRIILIPYTSILYNLLLTIPCALVCLLCQCYIDNSFTILMISIPLSICLWYGCKLLIGKLYLKHPY